MYSLDEVKKVDPEVAQAIIDEENRQNSHIELIASENWVSKAVMAAMGSPLTNKYAEGYPGKRYYGGCECVPLLSGFSENRSFFLRIPRRRAPVKGRIAAEKCISGLTAHHSCNIMCKLEMLFQDAIEPLGGDHLSTDRVTWRKSAACLA